MKSSITLNQCNNQNTRFGSFDIKLNEEPRYSPSVPKALHGELEIKRHSTYILYKLIHINGLNS